MRIRMVADFRYPLDDAGRERTLPRGRIFDEPDAIAEMAIAEGKAVTDELELAGDAVDQAGEVGATSVTPSPPAPAAKAKRSA